MTESFAALRKKYHQNVCEQIIRITRDKGKEYPNFADSSSTASVAIAKSILEQLSFAAENLENLPGQSTGGRFERLTRDYLQSAFEQLQHLRPGIWSYRTHVAISEFARYRHLANVKRLLESNLELASSLGGDYIITPDIVISRRAVSDDEINQMTKLVDSEDGIGRLSPFRNANSEGLTSFLHASISCKWTIRSDRSQNSRTEALNLIRNRKGPTPHVVAITAEPLPTRLAALALGTGDLDCVYHFALNELVIAVNDVDKTGSGQADMLHTLIEGKRLRDISDLPLDLAV
jgi:hypothetical protein